MPSVPRSHWSDWTTIEASLIDIVTNLYRDEVGMISPSIPIENLECGFPLKLKRRGRREDAELVEDRREVLRGQK